MEVQIPLTDISKCKEAYSGGYNVIDDRVLCAGYPEGGKDSCGVFDFLICTYKIFMFVYLFTIHLRVMLEDL